MKRILFAIMMIATACSISSPEKKEENKKELVRELVMKELHSRYKPADLEGLEIKIFTASPQTVYSNLAEYEFGRWKTYSQYALRMPEFKNIADSIYKLIEKNRNLIDKSDSTKIYYEAYTHIFKMDTTMKTNYFFDDSLKIIAVHRLR